MYYNLTLIPSDQHITPAHIERLEKFCDEEAILIDGNPDQNNLPITQPLTMEQMKKLRGAFEADHMDIFCTPQRSEPYKLLLADMDATMVTSETLDEIATRAGIGEKISAITTRAMRGELDFEAALKERVGLLKDFPADLLHQTLKETQITPGAKEFVTQLKEQGCICVLVSGGFTFFTERIKEQLNFDHHHGNLLHIDGDKLAGTVGEPILGKEAKLTFLKGYAENGGIALEDTVAIGDGANDLPMLAAAGLGIGYRPKPLLEDNLLNVLRFASMDQIVFPKKNGLSADLRFGPSPHNH